MSKAVTFWLTDEAIKMLEDMMNRTKLKKSFIVEQGIRKMNLILDKEIYLGVENENKNWSLGTL